jgi:Phosphotransferase system sorbitol-specific component IIC
MNGMFAVLVNAAASPPTPPVPAGDNPVMQGLVWVSTHFIGLFNASASALMGLITGILPLLIVLLTLMYAITTWVGEKRMTRAVQWSARYAITRYTLMPIIAVLMLTNPACYAFGIYLPERQKPAFYDAAVSFVHPVTAFFPHANAGEIFVWAGVAAGVLKASPSAYPKLALLYFLVGIAVIFIRGVMTELITRLMIRRSGLSAVFDEYDKAFALANIRSPRSKKSKAAAAATTEGMA